VLDSRTLGKRTVYVATPDGYDRTSNRYPVLVLLDADYGVMFRLGIAQAAYLADNTDHIPSVIVVGIANGADRIHDMTPVPTGSSVERFRTGGGATAFADFILGEVLPAVRSRFRTLPTTLLAGHSAGGLFALEVAANRPGSFQGVIAADPAIFYNDGVLARIYADAIAQSGLPLRLFAAYRGVDITVNDTVFRRFAQRLDSIKPPHVAFAYRRYADDTHPLVPLSALPDGLRFVFDGVSTQHLPIAKLDQRADSATLLNALAASESIYADSARQLRLPEPLPEPAMNTLARFALIRLKDPNLSLLVLRRSVALHPQSAQALATLADGYLVKGDTASAIAHLRTAIGISQSSVSPLPDGARDKLTKLRAGPRPPGTGS